MNHRLTVFALLVAFGGISPADEHATKSRPKTQYLIALSEYQLEMAAPHGLNESEILDQIRSSKAIPVATIQCTAVADTESSVQFGKQVAGTTSRQTNLRIGTMLQIHITSHERGAIADISYEASRLDDDSPSDVLTTTVQSTQIYEFGKDRLLVASTLGSSCHIVVAVREIPNPKPGG
jgi:hypothetical protein